jgi:hypothetical protein
MYDRIVTINNTHRLGPLVPALPEPNFPVSPDEFIGRKARLDADVT